MVVVDPSSVYQSQGLEYYNSWLAFHGPAEVLLCRNGRRREMEKTCSLKGEDDVLIASKLSPYRNKVTLCSTLKPPLTITQGSELGSSGTLWTCFRKRIYILFS